MSQDLQLYQASLDISSIEYDRLWQFLSEDERSRAVQFKRNALRRNFVAARGNLRTILAHWLNCEPREIQFGYGDRGKPYLQNVQELYFNLAHSQDLAIYVVSSDREVGIDLEYINSKCDVVGISKRYFLPLEQQIIQNCNQSLAIQSFYQAWTLKEAYGKATGQGIANILESIDVSPLLTRSLGKTLRIGNWSLKLLSTELELEANYTAALCIAE